MSDALRQRAELYLFDQLRLLGGRPPSRTADVAGKFAAMFRERVEALRTVGALTDSEATAWIARFDSGEDAPAPSAVARLEAEIGEAARELLEDLLAASAQGRGSGVRRNDSSAFERALAGLRDCGAISREEYAVWFDRFLAHPELPAEARQALQRRERRRPFCAGIELQGVVAGPATPLGDLRIRRVELYSDGLRLYWHRRVPGERPPDSEPGASKLSRQKPWEPSQRPLPEVRDDLGWRYESWGASHARAEQTGSAVEVEHATYTPALQANANRLHISHKGSVLELMVPT